MGPCSSTHTSEENTKISNNYMLKNLLQKLFIINVEQDVMTTVHLGSFVNSN
jgi:hypothetical protein